LVSQPELQSSSFYTAPPRLLELSLYPSLAPDTIVSV
jgi:hypothetical protein